MVKVMELHDIWLWCTDEISKIMGKPEEKLNIILAKSGRGYAIDVHKQKDGMWDKAVSSEPLTMLDLNGTGLFTINRVEKEDAKYLRMARSYAEKCAGFEFCVEYSTGGFDTYPIRREGKAKVKHLSNSTKHDFGTVEQVGLEEHEICTGEFVEGLNSCMVKTAREVEWQSELFGVNAHNVDIGGQKSQ